MGGYVSVVAAETLKVNGLFLLGPVLYMPPYANLDPHPKADSIALVHGRNDTIVPPENSYRFARTCNAEAHFIEGEHSLYDQIDEVCEFFGAFLNRFEHQDN